MFLLSGWSCSRGLTLSQIPIFAFLNLKSGTPGFALESTIIKRMIQVIDYMDVVLLFESIFDISSA